MARLPILIITSLMLLSPSWGIANGMYYEVNEEVKSSYKAIMSLNIDDARKSIQNLSETQPANFLYCTWLTMPIF